MTIKITACCDKCDASESFTDSTLVRPWLDAHRCPTPPVELPTEPTLGWVKSGEQGYLDTWCREGDGVYDSTGLWAQAKFIDSWTPAVAVPKVALDDLREYIDRITPSSVLTTGDLKVVLDFLAAVDAATRDHTHDTDTRGLG